MYTEKIRELIKENERLKVENKTWFSACYNKAEISSLHETIKQKNDEIDRLNDLISRKDDIIGHLSEERRYLRQSKSMSDNVYQEELRKKEEKIIRLESEVAMQRGLIKSVTYFS